LKATHRQWLETLFTGPYDSAGSLVAELEKFLTITGMSRTLFDNLAHAYHD